MTIKPIKTERDYRKALKEIENLWDAKPIELKPSGLAKILGGRSRVSEVLNKKRKLTVEMMRSLRKHLAIPAESLLA
jgi:HTH-type transcriptional regulator / antitoxin HigA